MSGQLTPLLWSPAHSGTESAVIPWISSPATRVVLLAAGALTASCLFVMPDLGTPVAFFAREITSDRAVGSVSPASSETATSPRSSARMIRDLKSRSGLTWDQLAGVFGVTRRAAHGWASGARLNAQHSETLNWLSQTLTRLEVPADPASTRAALLEVVASARHAAPNAASLRNGFSPFDRVAVHREADKWAHDRGEAIAMVESD